MAATRYNRGAVTYFHKGKTTVCSVGSPAWDQFVNGLDMQFYDIGTLPLQHTHRPDLIDNVWWGVPLYWWIPMVVNNQFDPFEGFKSSSQILVPKQ